MAFLMNMAAIRILVVTAHFWGVSMPSNVDDGIQDENE